MNRDLLTNASVTPTNLHQTVNKPNQQLHYHEWPNIDRFEFGLESVWRCAEVPAIYILHYFKYWCQDTNISYKSVEDLSISPHNN